MSLYDDIDIDKKDIGDPKSDVCEYLWKVNAVLCPSNQSACPCLAEHLAGISSDGSKALRLELMAVGLTKALSN